MISTNIYRHTFVVECPSDGELIIYQFEIEAKKAIMVEHIITATAMIKKGYHEQIADQLYEQFGGDQRLEATHQGVEILTIRSRS